VADKGLYAVQGAICDEIGLTNKSRGDVVVSTNKDIEQEAQNIRLIVEVKMSLVWNWN